MPGTEGKGGEQYTKALGFPGDVVVPNLTPFGVGSWSDGELDRAITVGVTREGRALFPVMPYPHYAKLCQDDVDAIVAFVRTLPPIEHTPPATSLSFPMSLIVNSIPADSARPACPPAGDVIERGRYLVEVASCVECHSPVKRGQVVPGSEFAGGRLMRVPTGTVASANLTPGGPLGGFTAEAFVARMRVHSAADAVVVEAGGLQTPMPWTAYAGMSDDDLAAIFAFLQTVPKKATTPGPEGEVSPVWQPTAP